MESPFDPISLVLAALIARAADCASVAVIAAANAVSRHCVAIEASAPRVFISFWALLDEGCIRAWRPAGELHDRADAQE